MEQEYDLKVCGSDASFDVLFYFTHFVRFTSYSTAAARDYLRTRDCGKQIRRLPWSSLCFFIKSAVSVSFPSRLGRKMTAGSGGRKKEALRPSKY